jgi:tetratricopeptide (TPR) repeat protein
MNDDYALIDDYLDGKLPKPDLEQFEQVLRQDPELQEALAFQRALRDSLRTQWQNKEKQDTLKAQLQQIGADYFQGERNASHQRKPWSVVSVAWWKAAVVAASLAGIVWWQWPTPASEGDLYGQYRQFPAAAFVTQGSSDAALGQATADFNQGRYAAALPVLLSALKDSPDDAELRFFVALCQIETGDIDSAIAALKSLENSAWGEEAQWHLALAYLKKGDAAACQSVLKSIGPGSPHVKEAARLLEKMGAR